MLDVFPALHGPLPLPVSENQLPPRVFKQGVLMSIIDKQRIAAVKHMEALGYTFTEGDWRAPCVTAPVVLDEADAMHSLLMLRADTLAGSTEGCDEAGEFARISETIRSYETKRWPDGNVRGGKG
jgi:hypothetical protein